MIDTPKPVSGNTQTPNHRGLDRISLSCRSKLSSERTPKIRKVKNYIIFYDEIIGKGQFGTVYKAQLASDLLTDNGSV